MADSRVIHIAYIHPDASEYTDRLSDGLYLGACLYPAAESYRRGRDHFPPMSVKDIDLGVRIETEGIYPIYRLPDDLIKNGVVLSGVYYSEKTSSLHVVLFNPSAPNVYIDNGTLVIAAIFASTEDADWHIAY